MSYVEAGKKHVRETIRFLKKMKFKNVDGGENFIIGGKQVDACAGHESTLIVIECTRQKDINRKIDSFRGKINDVIHGFKKEPKYKSYKHFVAIVAVKKQKVTSNNRDYGLKSRGHKVYIWDNNFVKYYYNLETTIGQYARYNLLSEINVKPEIKESVIIPAFRTQVGTKKRYVLFLFFAEADEILKMAYVARRELGNEYFYQRIIKKSRLSEISDYIKKGKVFPNSIIVALDKGSFRFDPVTQKDTDKINICLPNWLEFGTLTLLSSYRSCWLIDGQHRLYSYARSTGRGIIAISAFGRLNEETQADYFLDINREAKPVNPDLLWDLRGSLSPNSTRGVISNSVKSLAKIKDGFFTENIKIPSTGGKGKFRFNNLCVSIEKNGLAEPLLPHLHKNKKNPFWNSDYRSFEKNLAQAINQYFCCLNDGSDAGNKQIYSDGFVSVLISLFRLFVAHIEKKPGLDEERIFFTSIWRFINECTKEEIETLRKSLSSEAGKTDFRNTLILHLQEGYDQNFALGVIEREKSLAEKIKELEFQLNEFVNRLLEEKIGANWMEEHKYFPDGKQRKQCIDRAKRSNKAPWEYINFLTTITNIIKNPELWGRFFKNIFISQNRFHSMDEMITLSQRMWSYRSDKLSHTRSGPVTYTKDAEGLIQHTYNIFISIVKNNPD